MDLSTLLPLFLSKAGGNNERLAPLIKMASGEKPDISEVMSMAMAGSRRYAPMGLKPIANVASDTIVGKLAKFFA